MCPGAGWGRAVRLTLRGAGRDGQRWGACRPACAAGAWEAMGRQWQWEELLKARPAEKGRCSPGREASV